MRSTGRLKTRQPAQLASECKAAFINALKAQHIGRALGNPDHRMQGALRKTQLTKLHQQGLRLRVHPCDCKQGRGLQMRIQPALTFELQRSAALGQQLRSR
jgi:hypothetical protein